MLIRLIIRLLINAVALAAAASAVKGIHYEGVGSLLLMALVFGAVNAIIRPLVKIISFPLLILTIGLFTFVINALMLLLAGKLAQVFGINFSVEGFGAAFWGALIITIVSVVLSIFVHPRRTQD